LAAVRINPTRRSRPANSSTAKCPIRENPVAAMFPPPQDPRLGVGPCRLADPQATAHSVECGVLHGCTRDTGPRRGPGAPRSTDPGGGLTAIRRRASACRRTDTESSVPRILCQHRGKIPRTGARHRMPVIAVRSGPVETTIVEYASGGSGPLLPWARTAGPASLRPRTGAHQARQLRAIRSNGPAPPS
jgi:hypothetical protein